MANKPIKPGDKAAIQKLIEARKIAENDGTLGYCLILSAVGMLMPVLLSMAFDTLLPLTVIPIAIALSLFLLLTKKTRIRNRIKKLRVKLHEDFRLQAGDICCPTQSTVPIYQVTDVGENLSLVIILSKDTAEIGTDVRNVPAHRYRPFVFLD